MTDTTISDAVVFPQDDGTGLSDGDEDYNAAAYFSLIGKYKGDGSYVGEDKTGSPTLQFAGVDTANNEVDVESGYAYIMDGPHSVLPGTSTSYTTALPIDVPYVVVLPSSVANLALGSGTNDLWLAVDPTANDSVYIRHGSGLSAPSDPSVKLGTVDAGDGSTTRANDHASISSSSVSVADSLTYPSGDTIQTSPMLVGYRPAPSGPLRLDGANSGGITFNESQNDVLLIGREADQSFVTLDLRVNGATADYVNITVGGSKNSGQDAWKAIADDNSVFNQWIFVNKSTGSAIAKTLQTKDSLSHLSHGAYTSLGTANAIDSLTFLTQSGDPTTIEFEVLIR